jgi:hypothetical protein
MPDQDLGTGELHHAQVVPDVSLPADDHAAAVVEPGKEPFDFPAALRASQRAEGRFEHGPLDVGEVHAVEYDGDPIDVPVKAARLSGQLFSEVRAAERPCAKYQQ